MSVMNIHALQRAVQALSDSTRHNKEWPMQQQGLRYTCVCFSITCHWMRYITALVMARAVARTPKRSVLDLQTSAISTPVRSPQCCDLVPSLIRVLEFIEDFLDKFFEHLKDLLVQVISCLLLVDEGLRGGGAVIGLQRNPLGEDLFLTQNPLIMMVFGFSMFCFDWMYTTTCLGRLNIGLRPMRQIGLRPVRQTSSQTPTDMKNYLAWLAQAKVPMRSGSRKRSFIFMTFFVSSSSQAIMAVVSQAFLVKVALMIWTSCKSLLTLSIAVLRVDSAFW